MISLYQANVGTQRRLQTFAKASTELDRKQIDKLFGASESTMKTEFLFLVSQIKDAVDLELVTMALRTGDVTNLIVTTEKLALGLSGAWAEIYQEGGDLSTSFLSQAENLRVRFDIQNQNAVQAVKSNSLKLVREVTDEQRNVFRDVLDRGMQQGINPREMARELRDSVGLTQYQEGIVQNYRRQLEQGSLQALNRELRDARFDRTVRRAVAEGTALPQETIDRMVDRYRDNWINFRAENIARTEALRAASMGLQDGFEQAVARGDIEEGSVIRTWIARHDGRTRSWHEDMDRQQRGLNEPFVSGLGNELLIPRDPEAPPEDSSNCRCAVTYRLR